ARVENKYAAGRLAFTEYGCPLWVREGDRKCREPANDFGAEVAALSEWSRRAFVSSLDKLQLTGCQHGDTSLELAV
ncbi:MAG: hypothetical protein WAN62_13270, partial [Candidatus Acidiferrum sp.]